jgi:mRNA interferase HicA
MKSSEFLREIKRKGWIFLRRGKGRHLIFDKNGRQAVVPDHGSKELGKGLERKLRKEMQL